MFCNRQNFQLVFGRPFVNGSPSPIGLLSVLSCLFVTLVYCRQTVGRIKIKLGMQVGLSTGNIVLDGELGTHLPPQRGTTLQFTAYLRCGQTAGWIKMPLGVEVGLGPSDFMLDGDSAPKKGGHSPPPIFGPCLVWPNGWMDQHATWYGGKPQPRGHSDRWGPALPPLRGTAPNFWLMCIVANGHPSQLLLSSCKLFIYCDVRPDF